jgi:type IV pilus assembly protein PilQ
MIPNDTNAEVKWDLKEDNLKFMRILTAFLMSISILASSPNLFAQPSKQYAVQKISFDFRDADIVNVLKLIAEAAGLNVVVGDEVKGRITMRLVDLTWDQALEVVLQSRSLGMVRVGNVVRIESLDKLRKEQEVQLISKRAHEKMEDLKTELIRLKYAIAREMVPLVKGFLSERGMVTADERTNTLVIRDILKNIETIKELLR